MFKLNRVISAGLALATLWSGASSYLNAGCVEPWNELSLSGAWSTNDVRTKFHGRRGFERSFKGDDINVWKIGVQGRLSTPNFDCCCDDSGWLNNFYLRGYGYYGWVTDGKFHADRRDEGSLIRQRGGRKIKDGNTVNGNIGLGYLFPVCDEFAIGPAFGWAYDEVRIKNKGRHHDNNVVDAIDGNRFDNRHGRTLTSTWQGPWLGVDFAYNWCLCDCGQVRLEAGYEYHWAEFRLKLKQGHDRGFNNNNDNHHFRSKDGSGNLVYVNAWWNLCDCWDIGLGFKWRDFDGHKKKHRSSASDSPSIVLNDNGNNNHHKRSKSSNRWESFELALDLAYNF